MASVKLGAIDVTFKPQIAASGQSWQPELSSSGQHGMARSDIPAMPDDLATAGFAIGAKTKPATTSSASRRAMYRRKTIRYHDIRAVWPEVCDRSQICQQ
jgi:hypothetical protein